jgi:hypothetical protein
MRILCVLAVLLGFGTVWAQAQTSMGNNFFEKLKEETEKKSEDTCFCQVKMSTYYT